MERGEGGDSGGKRQSMLFDTSFQRGTRSEGVSLEAEGSPEQDLSPLVNRNASRTRLSRKETGC